MKKRIIFVIMCLVIIVGCAAAAGVFKVLGFESTVVSMHIGANDNRLVV